MQYRIMSEYFDLWGVDPSAVNGDIVDDAEIERLAAEWETTVEDLKNQVEEIKPMYWWLVDNNISANALETITKLDAKDKDEAIEMYERALAHLTPGEIKKRDEFYIAYAAETEDGYMDDDTITEIYSLM